MRSMSRSLIALSALLYTKELPANFKNVLTLCTHKFSTETFPIARQMLGESSSQYILYIMIDKYDEMMSIKKTAHYYRDFLEKLQHNLNITF